MSPPTHTCTLQGLIEHAQALNGGHDGVLLFTDNPDALFQLVRLVTVQIAGSIIDVTVYFGEVDELEFSDHYQTRGHTWQNMVRHHLADARAGKAQVLVVTGVFKEGGT